MKFLALALLALLAAPLRAQTEPDFESDIRAQSDAIRLLRSLPSGRPPAVDLRAQFPGDRADFDQGGLNVCHDVAAAAVVEAALFRATGERAELSVADLFLENTVLRRGREDAPPGGESDSMLGDIRFALEHGVLPADALPYAKLAPAYLAFKSSPDGARADRTKEWAERFEAKQESWWPGRTERRRRAIREALADFRLDRWLLPADKMARFNPRVLTPEQCRAEGREQEKFLLAHLSAGRPVAVGFDAAGLPGPAKDSTAVAGHAAVVDGVRFEKGEPVFTMINAWGNSFREDQLCRIDEMGAVLAPGGR